MGILIRGRCLHRFADNTDVLCGVMAELHQVKMFQGVEHLRDHDAAAGRMVGSQ